MAGTITVQVWFSQDKEYTSAAENGILKSIIYCWDETGNVVYILLFLTVMVESTKVYHPGGHYRDYYPGALSSDELKRFDLMMGYQDSVLSNGCQETRHVILVREYRKISNISQTPNPKT